MNERIRVVVADDQNISRGFFEMYVHASDRYELAASLRTAEEAVDFVEENEADLMILDVIMQENKINKNNKQWQKSNLCAPNRTSTLALLVTLTMVRQL